MFITFEGVDGSGKSTQTKQTAAYLRARGYDVLLTREPGGTVIGDQIRTVLFGKKGDVRKDAMSPQSELLLFCASRAQLVREVIHPHLAKGGIVLCDRYADSSLAYQGYGHGLELEMVRNILDFATEGLRPDLTIYLDIKPNVALKRRETGSLFGEEWNRLDDMELAFHRRVYEGYAEMMRADPARWVAVNADQAEGKVQAEIIQQLATRLPTAERSNG
jgi:dTMP kinase